MKRENTQSISQVMQHFLEEEQLSEGMQKARVVEAFEALADERYHCKTCRSVYVKDAVLHVQALSSVLKYSMNLEKRQLLEELNKRIEQNIVNEITIR